MTNDIDELTALNLDFVASRRDTILRRSVSGYISRSATG